MCVSVHSSCILRYNDTHDMALYRLGLRCSAAFLILTLSVARSEDKKMVAIMSTPNQNHLLAALPAEILERISPHLELISMPLGEVLCESGGQLQYVYFPTTAIVSLHYVMENGASTEIAGVGNEGVLGISLFMGGNTTPSRATVQTAGYGYRLKGRLLMEEFNRAGGRRTGALQNLLLRYTQALITQMSQTAVCNRHHSVEQQLCRWLLLTLDRLPSNELTMTQELIASMLGVRREGITEAAGHLQQAGFIRYRRGHITVLDRSGLESRVCECYTVVKNEYDRLLCDVRKRQKLPSASHG
jgi:CRP-like cAMP-binding protein